MHRDQRGTISILSVFAVLLLTMLLGMVMNVGRQVDGKIRMQNAADAVAYSGGVALARGMNTLAFTNHLLCDVFAVTAFMREARDRNAEKYVPSILAAWTRIGPVFGRSGFPKFERLGPAIVQKVPLEQQLVQTYSDWGTASSERVLPLMEQILAEELIPRYQQAVVEAFPEIAQMAALEVARRNGEPDVGRGPMLGALWRSSGELVGGSSEAMYPTLPVADPLTSPVYLARARQQRQSTSHRYLSDWNNEAMAAFDREAKMCQFAGLWRSFTCGQLEKLLKENADRNLPYQIRVTGDEIIDANAHIERSFMFLGVAYWHKPAVMAPRIFRNPVDGDPLCFAQVMLFVPQSRLVWQWYYSGGGGAGSVPIGGVPGDFPTLPDDNPTPVPGGGGQGRWVVGRQGVPTDWDLMNQHWTCQLVPATMTNLATILQTAPTLPAFAGENIEPPKLGGLTSDDIRRINTH